MLAGSALQSYENSLAKNYNTTKSGTQETIHVKLQLFTRPQHPRCPHRANGKAAANRP